MALIVQKYGGTSVGSVERIQAVAQRVVQAVKAGNDLVVVVSAMGKTTDGLVKLANELSPNPSRREMDMLLSTGEQVSIALLSMALQALGQPAISLTGAQVGIVTESEHARARILQIKTERLERHLKEGKVVVVAGFQGITDTDDLEITTLGRGGSDTSAVALAAALQASFCEIYTDVPGILTTDPRLVPDAQLMAAITCDEMLELASLGAKVLHPRAVEIARNYGLPLVVRSSWTEEPGTWVVSPLPQTRPLTGLELVSPVDGVEFDTDQAKVSLLRVPDRPGVAARLFGEIAHQNLDVDLIIQSIHESNTNDIAFTVTKSSLKQAEAVASAILPALSAGMMHPDGDAEVMVEQRIAKVAIAGAGMIGRPGVAAQMFSTLAAAGINIGMISTSEVKVSCVIDDSDCDRAIVALCEAFDVRESGVRRQEAGVGGNGAAGGAEEAWETGEQEGNSKLKTQNPKLSNIAAQRATQSSNLPVRGVALDLNQARLAIRHIPDRPGMAAELFQLLARQKISVDMIIQSQRCRVINGMTTRDIAFTVGHLDADIACAVLQKAAHTLGCGEITVDREIAKVSIVGSGMVHQPGTAARMFEALANHQINIQMIATSEIKVSCVVAKADGIAALQLIHAAFGLSGKHSIQVSA